LPDTDTILKDVKTHAEGSAALLAALGTLYVGGPVPLDELPYWFVDEYRPSKTDVAFGTGYVEEHNVEFQLYGEAAATLYGYHDTLNQRFDRATVTLTSGRFLACERQFSHRMKTRLVSKNNIPVYLAISRFRFKVDRTR
jgi:hypothetical protein